MPGRPVRTLIVDDSMVVRRLVAHGLRQDPRVEVVGHAADVPQAKAQILKLSPDVITMDWVMPGGGGEALIQWLAVRPSAPKVVVFSGYLSQVPQRGAGSGFGAMARIAKPSLKGGESYLSVVNGLSLAIQNAARATRARVGLKPSARRAELSASVIAVGASTGGPEALMRFLADVRADAPPIVLVQHMPAWAVGDFVRSVDKKVSMRVQVARLGARLLPGHVFVAPGDRHVLVHKSEHGLILRLMSGPSVSGHCPSVDVLMKSVAQSAGARGLGVLLTGMGSDGAQGMLELRTAGGMTLAQDERSSMVFGMPREAWRLGAVQELVALREMGGRVNALLVNRGK